MISDLILYCISQGRRAQKTTSNNAPQEVGNEINHSMFFSLSDLRILRMNHAFSQISSKSAGNRYATVPLRNTEHFVDFHLVETSNLWDQIKYN